MLTMFSSNRNIVASGESLLVQEVRLVTEKYKLSEQRRGRDSEINMRIAGLLIAAFLLPLQAHAQEAGNRLNLVCSGSGAANKSVNTYGQAWDSDGNSAGAMVTQQRSVGFEDQLQLWIEGDSGKARLPRAMLPPIRGGEGGWFEVKNIRISENEITGTVNVNVINHPKLVLDRLTGTVSLAGKAGQFNGQCQKFDPATVKRAF